MPGRVRPQAPTVGGEGGAGGGRGKREGSYRLANIDSTTTARGAGETERRRGRVGERRGVGARAGPEGEGEGGLRFYLWPALARPRHPCGPISPAPASPESGRERGVTAPDPLAVGGSGSRAGGAVRLGSGLLRPSSRSERSPPRAVRQGADRHLSRRRVRERGGSETRARTTIPFETPPRPPACRRR